MRRVLLSAAVLLCALGTPLQAQAPLDLTSGSRMQLHWRSSDDALVVGRLVSVSPNEISYRLEGSQLVWTDPLARVSSLRVSQGRSRLHSAWRGALWGGYLGGAGGGIAGPLAARSLDRGVGESSALLGVTAGLIGAGVGAVIGAILAPERWRSYQFVVQP